MRQRLFRGNLSTSWREVQPARSKLISLAALANPPFPRGPLPPVFKIVFEGKYFTKGGANIATRELVSSIYQAFFYRGLPYDCSRQNGPAWDYEFACILAGDVSEEGSLQRAREALPGKVKKAFGRGRTSM